MVKVKDILSVAEKHLNGVEGQIDKQVGKDFLIFDKYTPDFQILPDFTLHDFLTKNPVDSRTRIDVKVLETVQNVNEMYRKKMKKFDHRNECRVVIKETLITRNMRGAYKYTDKQRDILEKGSGIVIVPHLSYPHHMAELHKEIRKYRLTTTNLMGMYMYHDRVFLDSLYDGFIRVSPYNGNVYYRDPVSHLIAVRPPLSPLRYEPLPSGPL